MLRSYLLRTLKKRQGGWGVGVMADYRVIMRSDYNVLSRYVGLCYNWKESTGKRVSEICRYTSL